MCTVTYLPLPGGFVLTHNRDEAPLRSPKGLARVPYEGCDLLFPRDTLAGGTWITAADNGRSACLLNGAFQRHERRLPYRRSRGLVFLDSFSYANPVDFAVQYNFEGIEPFTWLSFSSQSVVEMRWDGRETHLKQLPPDQAHFWCSATLYEPSVQLLREKVFRDWLAHPPATMGPEAILQLHRTGSVGDPEQDFVMNREGRVQTVSITQLIRRKDQWQMEYFDLLSGAADQQVMQIFSSPITAQ